MTNTSSRGEQDILLFVPEGKSAFEPVICILFLLEKWSQMWEVVVIKELVIISERDGFLSL